MSTSECTSGDANDGITRKTFHTGSKLELKVVIEFALERTFGHRHLATLVPVTNDCPVASLGLSMKIGYASAPQTRLFAFREARRDDGYERATCVSSVGGGRCESVFEFSFPFSSLF